MYSGMFGRNLLPCSSDLKMEPVYSHIVSKAVPHYAVSHTQDYGDFQIKTPKLIS
jgi:hypothetical protein